MSTCLPWQIKILVILNFIVYAQMEASSLYQSALSLADDGLSSGASSDSVSSDHSAGENASEAVSNGCPHCGSLPRQVKRKKAKKAAGESAADAEKKERSPAQVQAIGKAHAARKANLALLRSAQEAKKNGEELSEEQAAALLKDEVAREAARVKREEKKKAAAAEKMDLDVLPIAE
jgi:predicted  nucleic acid-binding Zn-ribbon protein